MFSRTLCVETRGISVSNVLPCKARPVQCQSQFCSEQAVGTVAKATGELWVLNVT